MNPWLCLDVSRYHHFLVPGPHELASWPLIDSLVHPQAFVSHSCLGFRQQVGLINRKHWVLLGLRLLPR